MGESGSGKTTLLNILATLDKPTSGEILLDGKSLVHISDKEVSAFRRKNLGFVFQDFNLLDTFSLRDNIYLPLVLAGEDYREMAQKIRPIAQALHITELLEKYPYEVSGGQKQRTAIGVAALRDAEVLIFDEPTSGLDYKNMESVAEILSALSKRGKAILVISHDNELLMKICSRVIRVDERTSS